MRKFLCCLLTTSFLSTVTLASDEVYTLLSPDQRIRVEITTGDHVSYRVQWDGVDVLAPSALSMTLGNGEKLGANPKVLQATEREVNETVIPQFENTARLQDHFNELTLRMKGRYSVIFRVYNNGVAYRFSTAFNRPVKIREEEVSYNFYRDPTGYFMETPGFEHPYEDHYRYQHLSQVDSGHYAALPLLIEVADNVKALITEAGLLDYPGLYFVPSGTGMKGVSPRYPRVTQVGGHRNFNMVVKERENFIAKTEGTRTFPWRVMIMVREDKELLQNHLVYLLSAPSRIKDISWIQPGKVAWDWWNALNLSGVDFKAGINTETYKYFIDFAAANNIEYVNLDDGWSDQFDLLSTADDVNMPELVRYAREKGVKLILWCVWYVLDRQMEEALDLFNEWGIAGIKVDFMNRDDQVVVKFYERLAREAAERKLIINFHGAFKPTGLRRTYPNVINREAVLGLEYNKWSDLVTPRHDLVIPFIRMAVGPMDYTPGAMRNGGLENFQPIFNHPMSQGTRVHQLAMFVIYHAPLQMLADAPTAYEREPEVLNFLSAVPVSWDETVVLDGRIGEYLMMARRKGKIWYVGAMTNETGRTLDLSFNFLKEGNYSIEILMDGINAHRNGHDYRKVVTNIKNKDDETITMAPGGGWVARISPVQ